LEFRRKLGQRFINPPPEGDAVGNRGRYGNRAEAGDVLVEDLTVDAAGLDQAALLPSGCLAKAHDTLEADVEASIAAIERVSPGPVVLCGHSYGGTVITKAGVHPRVAALVYICALGPDETETSASIQAKFPTTDVFQNIDVQNGRVWLKPGTGVPCFAGDLSAEEQGFVYATAAPPAAELFTQQVDGVAWRSKPNWYIVGAEDRAVHPDLQRFCAKRMGATTTELKSSHVPMLSQPRAVLDVIRKAANAVQQKSKVA
jgi:pimeloyl-ACP methyl ester carboxylesterase